jgi:flagellar basal-body rod protein FlgB
MNIIDNALGVHAQALGLRSKRMELLARNIANAETPHFKAKDSTSTCPRLKMKRVRSFVFPSMLPLTATPLR